MKRTLLPACLLTLAAACQSLATGPVDEHHRKELFSLVSGLEGTWQGIGANGEISTTRFDVTSGGSVVRETMFPGTPHEMVNMYTLDGDDLVMTHYCAGGNQPTMRAHAMEGNALPFHFESVRDLNDPDQTYMGEMTLVFQANGTIEQRWTGLKHGKPDPEHAMVFTMQRR